MGEAKGARGSKKQVEVPDEERNKTPLKSQMRSESAFQPIDWAPTTNMISGMESTLKLKPRKERGSTTEKEGTKAQQQLWTRTTAGCFVEFKEEPGRESVIRSPEG